MMKKSYRFCFLDKQRVGDTLPALFDILYENMEQIAPFGKPYGDAKAEWLGQVAPAMAKEKRQIILMHDGDALVGYAQYYTNDRLLMIEEIQLVRSFQRTRLLSEFLKFMKAVLKDKPEYIEAYADKRNVNSMRLMESLGMKIIGTDGGFYHYRGSLGAFQKVGKEK